MCVWRPEDFYIPEDISAEFSALSHWENFPQAMVTSGGGFNKITIGSVKRNSVDIMYARTFETIQLTKRNLTPYVGSDLQGFNGTTTKPWGYVDLIITVGANETAKSVKVQFLVVNCPSLYQCILGRTAIADLLAVPSTAHLKIKYYTNKGQVATLHGDIESARRCFD
ncbi:hypothetical protein A2U01_0031278, partial [Trifolium medium]|nr:hypothetical protein [Trifolium medium]